MDKFEELNKLFVEAVMEKVEFKDFHFNLKEDEDSEEDVNLDMNDDGENSEEIENIEMTIENNDSSEDSLEEEKTAEKQNNRYVSQ